MTSALLENERTMKPKKILALQDCLDAMRVKQVMTFNECNSLVLFMYESTGWSPSPGMSGNEIAAFANLVIARYSEKAGIGAGGAP